LPDSVVPAAKAPVPLAGGHSDEQPPAVVHMDVVDVSGENM
jgi:hypothetical protein